MRRRHASSSGKPRWHPSGTVRATPAVIRFSRSINPICTASRSKPPSELKKIGMVALRQDGQELPETLGGTLIKLALPGDPLAAASPAGVWLTGGNNKNHRLASDLCELALEFFGIVARSNRNLRKAAKHRRHTPLNFRIIVRFVL